MGSYSEIVLGFEFRPDTPDYVMSAFSALAAPRPGEWVEGPVPELPPPYRFENYGDADWEPTDELADPAEDPEPWHHDWAGWFSNTLNVSTVPTAQLVWTRSGFWTLACRWGIKSHPLSVVPALRWLGPHLRAFHLRSVLLGYGQYDADPLPVLIWLTPDGDVKGQDLDDGSHPFSNRYRGPDTD